MEERVDDAWVAPTEVGPRSVRWRDADVGIGRYRSAQDGVQRRVDVLEHVGQGGRAVERSAVV